jgi:hypothetical protein
VWENAYSEVFLSRFEKELVKKAVFTSLMEAKFLAKEYKSHYNRERCADALCYCTPAELSLGVVRCGRRGCGVCEGATIGDHTLIAAGVENQGQRGTCEAKISIMEDSVALMR